jgi:uncharacterized protein DUF3891
VILRPAAASARDNAAAPVWDVISATQHKNNNGAGLVPQASHAVLAGVLAENFAPGVAPQLEDADAGAGVGVIQGIALHDIGWTSFDYEILLGQREAVSFLDETPRRFVRACQASIDAAQGAAAIAGLIVSRHFSRLGEYRQAQQTDGPEDAATIADFLARECKRQEVLFGDVPRTVAEVEALVDALQFADVLSLYLCSGAQRAAELPELNGVRYTVEGRGGGAYAFAPVLLRGPVDATFPVHRVMAGRAAERSDVTLSLG